MWSNVRVFGAPLALVIWLISTVILAELWLGCAIYVVGFLPDCSGTAPLFMARWLRADGEAGIEIVEITAYGLSGLAVAAFVTVLWLIRKWIKSC